MNAPAGLWLGSLGLAALVAATLTLPGRRGRALAIAGSILLAGLLIAIDNWDTERFSAFRNSPVALTAASLGGAAAIGALALAIRRRPWLFIVLAVLALPFRVPVGFGSDDPHLLVPLYLVIAAGAAAHLAASLGERSDAVAKPATAPVAGRLLAGLLAATALLYALQAGYSSDFSAALNKLAFFFAPFAAAFALVREQPIDSRILRICLGVLVAQAFVFTAVGGLQLAGGELLWNDKVIAGNEVHTWFRVNSLFWDPNIFGRYLTVAMLAAASLIAFARTPTHQLLASGVFVIGLAGLAMSFSQSSGIALLSGLAVIGAIRWQLQGAVAAGLLALAGVAAILLAGGSGVEGELTSGRSLDEQTSGRGTLVNGGIELAKDRPLLGHGSGSFEAEFRSRFGGGVGVAVTSHTEPITVAAEQGIVGLTVYVALLLGSLRVLCWPLLSSRGSRFRAPPSAEQAPAIARTALVGIFVAMMVHSLIYAAFLTDPITWIVLAFGVALAGGGFPALPAAKGARTPSPEPAPAG